jgi:DNA invertase Pin-like site-specific DNA recombinase
MIIGYGRCSTKEQTKDLTKERQIATLKQLGAEKVYFDVETGTNPNRKEVVLS